MHFFLFPYSISAFHGMEENQDGPDRVSDSRAREDALDESLSYLLGL